MPTPFSEERAEQISRHLKLLTFLFVIVPIVLLVVFIEFRFRSIEESLPNRAPSVRDEARQELDKMPWHPVTGQRLYVPAYSHVYHQKGEPYLLTVTLNVRNTDMDNEIVVTSVRYFDTSGKELRSLLQKPLQLAPLAATEFVIQRDDKFGGSGASFIVEWQAGTEVNQPIVETVMVDTSNTQGISFTASAVPIRETLPASESSSDPEGEEPSAN
ncbi:DUF3124 domain-containing protein [Rhodopirellula bahusiensis]|uniref:DUF3124 domain-containing protein n=1 Tax=Rhodopirellula bahusiensis TaxID=2014065 RepID=A0A2G1W4A9_9BACT|nr:DUF3124 domain-containing protein [Rhodopirellula bahusiensis]PHQ33852.1 hypothetical protein CEE69_18200 [Rhodopirellula bahusiensis]